MNRFRALIEHTLKIVKLETVRDIRAKSMRRICPRDTYLRSRSLRPISKKYGFDRGKPIDRFFIESFLEQYRDDIHGKCLEVVDDTYIRRFGGDRVTKSDAIDHFPSGRANILGDLRNLSGVIAENVYDCIVLTQTLNVIDEYQAVLAECKRILKPGGVLLVTLPTVSPAWNLSINLWRFTDRSARFVFEQCFHSNALTVMPLGNRLASEYFWLGMSVEDTSKEVLSLRDSFPTIIGIRAVKEDQ